MDILSSILDAASRLTKKDLGEADRWAHWYCVHPNALNETIDSFYPPPLVCVPLAVALAAVSGEGDGEGLTTQYCREALYGFNEAGFANEFESLEENKEAKALCGDGDGDATELRKFVNDRFVRIEQRLDASRAESRADHGKTQDSLTAMSKDLQNRPAALPIDSVSTLEGKVDEILGGVLDTRELLLRSHRATTMPPFFIIVTRAVRETLRVIFRAPPVGDDEEKDEDSGWSDWVRSKFRDSKDVVVERYKRVFKEKQYVYFISPARHPRTGQYGIARYYL